MTGDYPVEVPVSLRKGVLERNDLPAGGLERVLHAGMTADEADEVAPPLA
jgi:hypothetical protein